jgi:hypothetical protein
MSDTPSPVTVLVWLERFGGGPRSYRALMKFSGFQQCAELAAPLCAREQRTFGNHNAGLLVALGAEVTRLTIYRMHEVAEHAPGM